MPLVSTATLVADVQRRGGAVGAFNAICLEHSEAIVAGAERAGLAVIIQLSENAVKFHGGQLAPIALASAAIASQATVPVALHLDHVEDDALLLQAADYGFGSVMFDASKRPFAENVEATRAAAEWGHSKAIWVEAELGEVGGKDGAHAPGVRTDPDEAAAYVAATGVDALAVAVGSSHAMTDRTAVLDHALIARLAAAVGVPLVLHGSSGVPDDELRAAVRAGMVKVNIGTALNIAFTAAVREHLAAHPSVVDPRKYLAPGRDAMAAVVAAQLQVLIG